MQGVVTSIFGNDINTDDIIRADILQESTKKDFFAQYAFEKYDTDFITRCKREKSNIIIAWENFWCGSSREQAVYAIRYNDVKIVIAKSFPDIFYRNALNNGLILIKFPEIEKISMGDKLELDIEKLQIKNITKNEIYNFFVSEEDTLLIKHGGQLGVIKNYIKEEKIYIKKVNQESSNIWENSQKQWQTMVEKIISNHVKEKVFAGDKVSTLPIDLVYLNEVIGPASIVYFLEDFKENSQVKNPAWVFFIPDHTIPSSSIQVTKGIDLMKAFAKKHNITMFKQGRGIEHIVGIEEGYVVPWSIILGTDSHTCTNGAMNTFSLGVGTTDAEYALASSAIFNFEVPKSIKINLTGKLQKWVSAKDIVLKILELLWADGANKMVMEFHGSGIKDLAMDARTTISNMAVEMSARSAIFPYDEVVEESIPSNPQYDSNPVFADDDAMYEKVFEIDMTTLEPMIAFPHKPANSIEISKIQEQIKKSQKINSLDFPKITQEDTHINQAFLWACTNWKYDDLVAAAEILKWRKISDEVTFVVIPASSEIYKKALRNGLIEIFVEAGCLVESPNCGTCFGKHMGVTSDKTRIISSSNRNYKGRMWDPETLIFLASPASVAASAIKWVITDPREFL